MLSLHLKPSVTTTNVSRWTSSCHTSGFDPGVDSTIVKYKLKI